MLAVLPFDNLGGDSREDYFCDGLTEEVITELASVNGGRLGVIARSSVSRYRNRDGDLQEIVRQLEVDYLLRGSVRRDGERARISVRVLRARDRSYLWARSFEREMRDALGLQSEIARAIADAIDVQLMGRSPAVTARPRHSHPEAYEAYLRGRFFWNRRTERDIERAIELFKEAVELEARLRPGLQRSRRCLPHARQQLRRGVEAPARGFSRGPGRRDESPGARRWAGRGARLARRRPGRI